MSKPNDLKGYMRLKQSQMESVFAFPKTREDAWSLACGHTVAAIVLSAEFSLHLSEFSKCYPTLAWDGRTNPRELASQLTLLCRFCSNKSIN